MSNIGAVLGATVVYKNNLQKEGVDNLIEGENNAVQDSVTGC